jgi:hypothetical protein
MLEKTCPFKYILTMLWQEKTQFFWENRNVVYHAGWWDARIIVGFKEDSNADEYLENLKTKLYFLDSVKCKEGDAFFLETGRYTL